MDGPGADRTAVDRRTLLEQSHRLLKANRSEQALVLLDGLAQRHPGEPDILATRTYCLGRLGRFTEANALCAELDTLPEGETWTASLRTYLDSARRRISTGNQDSSRIRDRVIGAPPSRHLAKRIESIWASVEKEFETFRTMQREAETTIAELRETIQEKNRFFQEQDGLLETIQGLKAERDNLGSERSRVSATLEETQEKARESAAEVQLLTEALGAQKIAHAGREAKHREEEGLNAVLTQKLSDSEERVTAADLEKAQRTALLRRLTDEKDVLAANISDREAEVQAARGLGLVFQTQLDALRAANGELTDERDKAHTDVERLNENLAKTQEHLDARERELETARTELDRVQNEQAELQALRAGLESELAGLNARFAETQETLEATSGERDALELDRSELHGRIESLGRLQEEAASAIDRLKGDAAGLSAEKEGLEQNIQGLHAEVNTHERRETELTAAIARLEEHLEAQETLRAELRAQKDEARARVAALSTEIERLNEANAAAATEANERILGLLAELDGAADTRRVTEKERAAFETMLWETSARLDETTQRERDALVKAEMLQGQLQQREEDLSHLEADRSTLDAKVAALQGELAAVIEREAQANTQVKALHEDLAALEQRRQALEVEKTVLAQTLDGLRSDLERTTMNKALVEASLDASGQALSEAESRIGILIDENAKVQKALFDLRDEFGQVTQEKLQADSRVEALQRTGNEVQNRLRETTVQKEQTQEALQQLMKEHMALEHREREAAGQIEQLNEELDSRKQEIEEIVVSLTDADSEIEALTGEVTHIEEELDLIRTMELPKALEQKVRAYRETIDLRAEIELLRSQVW